MGPKVWDCSRMCLALLELWLLVFNAFLCSLYLLLNFLPVCPMYAMLQSGQVSLYVPERVYLSVDICLFPSRFWRGPGTLSRNG